MRFRDRRERYAANFQVESVGFRKGAPPQSNIELEFRTDQAGGTPRPDEAAQQALIDMVGSRQIPSQAPQSLAPYARWLSDELQTGVLARKHNLEFAAWLGVPPY